MKKAILKLTLLFNISFGLNFGGGINYSIAQTSWATDGWVVQNATGTPTFTSSGACTITSDCGTYNSSGVARIYKNANVNLTQATSGFTFNFNLNFGSNSSSGVGDGFSFVLMDGQAYGRGGGEMGYVNMTTVSWLAFEWDSWQNDAAVVLDPAGQPAQHLDINSNLNTGGVANSPVTAVTMGSEVRTGSSYNASISWVPNGSGGGTFTQTIVNGGTRTLSLTLTAAQLAGYPWATNADFSFMANTNTGGCAVEQTQSACLVSIPAPINLYYFNGNFKNESVLLEWGTLAEINNHYFTLERSKDGVNWNTIATISATTSNQNGASYTYSDAFLENNGPVYYRLSQTDHDGTTTSYPIISVLKDQLNNISIIPNPCSEKTNITNIANSTIEISTLMGTVVQKNYSTLENEITIDVSALQNGMYMLKIQKDNSITNKTLIVKK